MPSFSGKKKKKKKNQHDGGSSDLKQQFTAADAQRLKITNTIRSTLTFGQWSLKKAGKKANQGFFNDIKTAEQLKKGMHTQFL